MGQIIRTACKVRWLFELHSLHLSSPGLLLASAIFPSTSSSHELWHSCLGHSSTSPVQLLVFMGILSTTSNSLFYCMACQLGKQLAFPFNKSDSYALTPFDIVHSDVRGPSLVPTMRNSWYFVAFVDDFSHYTWIYLMKNCKSRRSKYRFIDPKKIKVEFWNS